MSDSNPARKRAHERSPERTPKRTPKRRSVNPHKTALERRKLELEIKALTFKQSRLGRLTEVLQGVLPILAILSLVWTVVVGLNQQDAQRKDAESARFERAFARLGSSVASERATGVAQASALLRTVGSERDKNILTALANQLALDENVAVRSAILNVFSNLDSTVGAAALDAALKNIVDLHRVLVQSGGFTQFELATAIKDDRGIYFIPDRNDLLEIDPRDIDETFVRLDNLRSALMALLKAGGRTRQMDHIYCPDCKFDALGVDFSETSFKNAILPGTQWSLVRLARSSFRDAVITGANFTGAMLEGADFSVDEYNVQREQQLALRAMRYWPTRPLPSLDAFSTGAPTFVCANLKNANFDGHLLLVRLDDYPASNSRPNDGFLWGFTKADIAGADFSKGREMVIRRIEEGRENDLDVRAHRVKVSDKSPNSYYYTTIPLSYLEAYQRGQNAPQDREYDLVLLAMAKTFAMTENTDQAEFPAGVHAALKAERANATPSSFPTCDVYLKDLRDPPR